MGKEFFKKSQGSVVSAVWPIAQPLAEDLGLEIWDIKFVKEGPNHFLRVFIDKPDGITIDDCESMSRALDAPLDEADPIPVSYCLEVCSPGIDRELTCDEHLEKFIGSDVKIKLIRPNENGEKVLIGKLLDFDKNSVTIESEDKAQNKLNKENISHINLNY